MKENEKYTSEPDGEDPAGHTLQEGRSEDRESLLKEDSREDGQPAREPVSNWEEEENEEGDPLLVEKSEEEAMAALQERQEEADQQAQALRQSGTQEQVLEGGPEPVIAIKGLRKAFKDHEVLRGVDLHVNKGENVVVLGKSGSGKSVLIKCLVGLEWPDEGTINIFGEDLLSLNYQGLNEARLRIGFLFQNAALYDSMTVRENLAFPLRQHMKSLTKEKKDSVILEMLDNVGLVDSIDQMPSKLSGGQSKRIGLARTLILRPEIMLYDEPTTGLDTGTAKEISELIIKMKEKYNISSITITHDMACAKMTADRIIMMREGVVVAEGSYEELERSEDEWIRSFFY
ncbi:MAG TPA: ATP-binding cassette domain-containing protein [Puia sp.]|nr:ATP-binding cassette domain-containing protein [Puia sp.]